MSTDKIGLDLYLKYANQTEFPVVQQLLDQEVTPYCSDGKNDSHGPPPGGNCGSLIVTVGYLNKVHAKKEKYFRKWLAEKQEKAG